jgi:hypothetical protein
MLMGPVAASLLGPTLLSNQIMEAFLGTLCLAVGWLILLVIGLLVLVWLYKDANSRGMNGTLWALIFGVSCFIWFTWVIVLIVYLVIRKPKSVSPPSYVAVVPQPAYTAPPAPPAYAAPGAPQGYGAPPQPQAPGYGAAAPPAPQGPVNCKYCGSQVPAGALVCPRCGGRL